MPINNRGLAGQPVLSYYDYRSYSGQDVFLDLTFLDHTGVSSIPQSFTYQVDDMTNAQNMIPATTINTINNFQYSLQIPGSQLQMTHQWQGSQICQISWTAILGDGSTVRAITVIELISIQTPFSGS